MVTKTIERQRVESELIDYSYTPPCRVRYSGNLPDLEELPPQQFPDYRRATNYARDLSGRFGSSLSKVTVIDANEVVCWKIEYTETSL